MNDYDNSINMRVYNGTYPRSRASSPEQGNTPIVSSISSANTSGDSVILRSPDGGINPYYYDAKLRSESKEAINFLLLANRWTSLKSSILEEYGGYSPEEIAAIKEEADSKGEAINLTKYLSPEKLTLLTEKLNQEYGLKLTTEDINTFDTNPEYIEALKTKAEETIYNNSNVLSQITDMRLDSLGEWLKTAIGSSDTNLSSST